jgi:cytochrome c
MSDLRNNSIFGAVLATVLGVMGLGLGANALVHPHYPETPGYAPEVETAVSAGPAAAAAPAGPPDFGAVFADAEQLGELITLGDRLTSQCKTCHTFEAGGATVIGPNLHDVFGRRAASHAGFGYSDAMQAHDVTWDYMALNDFLTSPGRDVPGTQMIYAGLRRDRDRMAVIAYLRSISPNDVPLPAPLPPPVEAAETGAEEAAPG